MRAPSIVVLLAGAALVAGLGACKRGEGTAPEITALDRTTHEPKFPIAGGNHGDVDCDSCHGAFDTFTEFSCTTSGCHEKAKVDPVHTGLGDYAYEDAQCLACHPKGSVDFEHTRFPIGEGTTHPDRTCSSCHKTADRRQFDCTSCHEHDQPAMDGAHGTMADYGWDSAKCYQCHPDGKIPPFDHTRFPIGDGTTHVDRACSNCHKTPDRTQFDCTACHEHDQAAMDGAHGSLAGYGWDSAKCYQCHPDGQIPPFDHTWFPIGTGQTHTERTCSGCHPGPDRRQFTCVACHEDPATSANHAGLADYQYLDAQCLSCHPDGRVHMDHTPYFPIAAADQHGVVSCGDCHTAPGNRKVTTCNVCHSHTAADMGPKHTGKVPDFSTDTALCLRCHADSQVKRVATHLPFRIDSGTKHWRTGCLKCHPKLRLDKPYGADFSLPAMDCLACHNRSDMDDKHQGYATYQYRSPSCIQGGCHADGTKPGD